MKAHLASSRFEASSASRSSRLHIWDDPPATSQRVTLCSVSAPFRSGLLDTFCKLFLPCLNNSRCLHWRGLLFLHMGLKQHAGCSLTGQQTEHQLSDSEIPLAIHLLVPIASLKRSICLFPGLLLHIAVPSTFVFKVGGTFSTSSCPAAVETCSADSDPDRPLSWLPPLCFDVSLPASSCS